MCNSGIVSKPVIPVLGRLRQSNMSSRTVEIKKGGGVGGWQGGKLISSGSVCCLLTQLFPLPYKAFQFLTSNLPNLDIISWTTGNLIQKSLCLGRYLGVFSSLFSFNCFEVWGLKPFRINFDSRWKVEILHFSSVYVFLMSLSKNSYG